MESYCISGMGMNGTWGTDRARIVHIITRFDKGGSAENTFLTVTGLDPACYEVTLLYGDPGIANISAPEAAAVAENLARARERGVRLLPLPTLVRPLSPLKDLQTLIRLFFIIRSLHPHIVHTHTSKAGSWDDGQLSGQRCLLSATPPMATFFGVTSVPSQQSFSSSWNA